LQEHQRTVKLAKECLKQAQLRQKQYTDQHRGDVQFLVGQQVLLNTRNITFKGKLTRKLLPRWIGPFTVTRKAGILAYELDLPHTMRIHNVFHVSLLKEHKRDSRSTPPQPIMVEGEPEWEVEALLAHRKRGKTKRLAYLVRWKNHGPEQDEYLPKRKLIPGCQRLLRQYWERVKDDEY